MPTQPGNSPDPFPAQDAGVAAIRGKLLARLAEDEPSPFWQGRARRLAGVVAPVLAWMRDAKGVTLDRATTGAVMQLDALVALGTKQPVAIPASEARDLTDLPADMACGIRGYLADLPGYDPDRATPREGQARAIHGYTLSAIRRSLV